jgi:hypothetical protein
MTAARAPRTDPATTWATVWSRTVTRAQPSRATSRYPSSTNGPNVRASSATEPDATEQWMEIFHITVTRASTATLASMNAR